MLLCLQYKCITLVIHVFLIFEDEDEERVVRRDSSERLRITVYDILEQLASGMSTKEILEDTVIGARLPDLWNRGK